MTTYNESTAPSEEANTDVNRPTQVAKNRKLNNVHCISEENLCNVSQPLQNVFHKVSISCFGCDD